LARFVAFDVETPNAFNNRMSAIGVSVLEDGVITEEFYSLVNPEADFDWFNIQLTGITPEAVLYEPAFDDLWPTLKTYFDSGVLLAHNAPFDMKVLSLCLNAYGIDWRESVPYVCTCRLGRKLYPELPNHKLNTMCDLLNIELDRHNAASDARACALLMKNYLENGCDPARFIRRYDLYEGKTLYGTQR